MTEQKEIQPNKELDNKQYIECLQRKKAKRNQSKSD